MRWHSLVVFTTGLALTSACSSPESPHANPLVDAVFESWDRPGSPGCALAVAQGGAMIYARGYGYANLDYGTPITPQSVFDVASITKQFVAASLNMLEMEGKLSLDDNIRQWLPELPEYEWPITLRHMIYHTSGLRDYLNLFPLAGRNHYFPISHAQILDMMSRQRALVFPPGERYLYSNTAYMLLAQVVERASGKPFGEFTEEHIFKPLRMHGSLMYDNYEQIIPRRATGYDRDADGQVRMVHNYNFDVPGDGQLYSTVEDLLAWDNYLHGSEKPQIYASMLTEGALNNGDPIDLAQGLFLEEYRGLRTIYHTGSSWGSQSVLMRFVEPALAIAIACNDGNSDPQRLAWQVADHYLADQLAAVSREEKPGGVEPAARKHPEAPSLMSGQLAELAGTYFSAELDATYRFSVMDNDLAVRIEQEVPLLVNPVGDDYFVVRFSDQAYWEPPDACLEFSRNTANRIVGFRLSSGTERNIEFEKLQ